MIPINTLVSRNSYKNDILFRVVSNSNNTYTLYGVELRIVADCEEDDLRVENDKSRFEAVDEYHSIDKSDEYFYIPGKILHVDADNEYLKKCKKYYENLNLKVSYECLKENLMSKKIVEFIKKYRPSIVVLTGHDSYVKKSIGTKSHYKNSEFFAQAVKEIRKHETEKGKIIIISGACQSDYELLIKSGSTFASSPKKINIHALDPAIIASNIALHDINEVIDVKEILSKTKFGKDGIGGLSTKGMMQVGYPKIPK